MLEYGALYLLFRPGGTGSAIHTERIFPMPVAHIGRCNN
jgi:hypothetical protein